MKSKTDIDRLRLLLVLHFMMRFRNVKFGTYQAISKILGEEAPEPIVRDFISKFTERMDDTEK